MPQSEIKFEKIISFTDKPHFLARVEDWKEEGRHVKKLLLDYDKQYRSKICSTCSPEQQQKRNCLKLDMYTSGGVQLKHCSHMDNARVRKHKHTIRKHIQLHPAFKII